MAQTSELIRQFQNGDMTGFPSFYDATKKQVYFTALSIVKDRALAEDVMQDAYVSFLRAIDRIDPDRNVASYLSVAARNLALNKLKSAQRTVFDDEALATVAAQPLPDASGVDAILSLLERAEEREIVTYHVILGYKFREIASIMGAPLGTVLWRYNKAMHTLREKMGGGREKR